MNYGILKCSTVNIGDDIQSIAAKNFLPRVDYYIERDNMNLFLPFKGKNKFKFLKLFGYKPKIKIILNGWFSHHPNNWPPSNEFINPLITSFHISNEMGSSEKRFVTRESLSFFKAHEPIGCRDIHTLNLLSKHGINAYFSGCLTLTLNKYKTRKKNYICLVNIPNEIIELLPISLRQNIYKIDHIIKENNFIRRLQIAEDLLKLYAGARLIVTSKLHCALPALAFNTPVIFMHDNLLDVRFSGLLEMLNCYKLSDILKKNKKVNWNVVNKNKHHKFVNSLTTTCQKFI